MDVHFAAWAEEIEATWGELFSGGPTHMSIFQAHTWVISDQMTIGQNDHINEPKVKEQRSKLPHARSRVVIILGQ